MIFNEYCKKNNIDIFPKHREILDEFYGGDYRELVAVLGRRSGKNMLAVDIALRELEYLVGIDNPFAYYRLAEGNPIYILIVSASLDQSKIIFTEMKEIISKSEFLKPHLSDRSYDFDRISFLTNADIKKQKKDDVRVKGSVVFLSRCSGSDSLLGKRCFSLILNEMAFFRSTDDVVSGDRVYSALYPSTMDFRVDEKIESKVVSISSPRVEGDKFYDLYKCNKSGKMVVKYPTWEMNTDYTQGKLRQEFGFLSDGDFRSEFGAEFMPDSGNKTLSMRLPVVVTDKLKRIAREKAYESNKDVSYTDIIRFAIDEYVQGWSA